MGGAGAAALGRIGSWGVLGDTAIRSRSWNRRRGKSRRWSRSEAATGKIKACLLNRLLEAVGI